MKCFKLFLYLFFLQVGLSGQFAQAVMNSSTNWNVSPSGEFTYEIPFRLPPGIAGVQPRLSLQYGSQNGNGLVGVGWNLNGLSAITRCLKTPALDGSYGAVSLDSIDALCLDGQRLILQSGTYGTVGAVYATEVYDGSKIVGTALNGSGNSRAFVVHTKAGEVKEYLPFNTPSDNVAIQFVLSKVSDAKGNYWQVHYQSRISTGEIYPHLVCYTGNSRLNQAPKSCIEFGYGPVSNRFGSPVERIDPKVSYVGGFKVKSASLMSGVRTWINATVDSSGSTASISGNPVTEYRFEYRNSTLTERNLLTSVTECSSAGVCLPKIDFLWNDSLEPKGWISANHYIQPENAHSAGWGDIKPIYTDLNGDGLVDLLFHRTFGSYVYKGAYINTGNGWAPKTSNFDPPHPIAIDGRPDSGARFVDVNGDGLTDLLYHRHTAGGPSAYAYINTGGGWVSTPSMVPPFHIVTDSLFDLGARFVDINSDGRIDELYHRHHSGGVQVGAYLSTGTTWASTPAFNPPFHISADSVGDLGLRFVDFNGDSLPDIVYHRFFSGQVQKGAYRNTGSGWVLDDRYIPPFHISIDTVGDAGVRFADLNADGLVDMLYSRSFGGQTQSGAYLNTGAGWLNAPAFLPPVHFSQDEVGDLGVKLIDLNDDGLVDILSSRQQGATLNSTAYLNTGNGWKKEDAYALPYPMFIDGAGLTSLFVNDLDGDSKPDFNYHHYRDGQFNKAAYRNNRSRDVIGAVQIGGAKNVAGALEVFYRSYAQGMKNENMVVPSYAYPRAHVSPPAQIVSAVRTPSGLSATGAGVLRYKFLNAAADVASGRNFLGFEFMEVEPVGSDSVIGPTQRTTFSQLWPCNGLVKKHETLLPGGGNRATTDNILRVGLLGETVQLSCEDVSLNKKIVLPFVAEVITRQWEMTSSGGQGVELPRSSTVTSMDSFGNPLVIQERTLNADGTPTGYSRSTSNTYDSNLERMRQGRLIRSTVTHVKP